MSAPIYRASVFRKWSPLEDTPSGCNNPWAVVVTSRDGLPVETTITEMTHTEAFNSAAELLTELARLEKVA